MILSDRIDQINKQLPALQSAALVDLLRERIASLTERLIGTDSEQVRGAIKELRQLIDLPGQLQTELTYLTAGLSEQSDPAP